MNAPARTAPATPIPRNAAGEPPLGQGAHTFSDEQGEGFWPHDQAYQLPATRIVVVELEAGQWLAGLLVNGVLYETRDAALRAGIARVIRKARKFMRAKAGEGTSWSEGFAGRVIEWALSIKPAKYIGVQKCTLEEINPAANDAKDLTPKTASEEITPKDTIGITDPIVAELVAAHRARKVYPAGHTFSMTNPVINGQMVTLGTCSCGDSFSYPYGSAGHERMDAAIEAHRQKFDHLPEKVDGRGQPIAKPKKPRRNLTEEIIGNGNASQHLQSETGRPDGLNEGVSGARAGDDGATEQGGSGPSREQTRTAGLSSGASQENQAAGVAPVPSQPGTGGLNTSVPIIAEGASSPPLRSEPAPDVSPPGAGSSLSVPQQAAPIGAGSGRSAYEAELLVRPHYHDGTPRKPWHALDAEVQANWNRNPTPRWTAGAGSVADVKCEACAPDDLSSPATAGGEVSAIAGATPSQVRPDYGLHAGEITPVSNPALADNLNDDDDLAIEWPSYDAFLEDKIVTAPLRGIEVARDALHPWLKPHCKDLTLWALRLGCAAIFANFGLHKTAMQLEWCRQLHKNVGGATLNVVPLGVRHGFIKEALQLGMDVRFIRTNAEFHALSAEGVVHFLTNYESIREGKLDPNLFAACSLDEASVLRSYGSKTFQEFLPLFSKVEFKLVATATPSPNRYKELIHYAGFLGVMDTGLALTRWFQRNSEKAGDLTLYPHKEDEFWMWVHSWAAFLQRPSELGYSDEGYELPPLKLTWHEVPADHSKAQPERDGQRVMFRNVANSLQDAAKSRRDSLSSRIAKMVEIIAQDPDSHRVIWHDLEAEREAIEAALPGVVSIMGSMDIDEREEHLRAFEEGETKHFATKPILSGSGSNFQYHCHKAIYVGMPGDGYKFNDFIQSIYRLQRFGQTFPVEVDIIYSEDMRAGRATLEQKWALDSEMRKRMSAIILAHGLNTLPLRDALARTIGVQRVEVRGKNFIAINNDCVTECRTWPDNSVDQIITSIPFSNHYEYSASYRDFGHTDDNGHFWGQMDFLTCELLRMLKPGRLACVHVKDRVLFGSVTGEGVSTISPFHAEAIMHYRAHGFQYMGMIHIDTDVVKENADGSYRLGWSENCKDSTTKGVGSPEYVLLLRKRQSDHTRGYADMPVVKEKWNGEGLPADEALNDGYSRARWQIDAHAFWRSSGNRLLTADEFAGLPAQTLRKIFAKVSSERIYDYEAHVQIGERLERVKDLPAQWSCLAPGATNENTWHDVIRMHTLNSKQVQQGREKHICPLQFDIVDRLINRYSNEGELILDPFGGIGTIPYRAMLKGRKGALIELSATYFLDAIDHCRAVESKIAVPQLFDLVEFDAANAPPPPRT